MKTPKQWDNEATLIEFTNRNGDWIPERRQGEYVTLLMKTNKLLVAITNRDRKEAVRVLVSPDPIEDDVQPVIVVKPLCEASMTVTLRNIGEGTLYCLIRRESLGRFKKEIGYEYY